MIFGRNIGGYVIACITYHALKYERNIGRKIVLIQKKKRLILLSMEPWAAAKKSFKVVWQGHQLLSGFLAKGHLPQCHVRHICRLMWVKMRSYRQLWTGLVALPYSWGKPRKTSARRPSDKGCATSYHFIGSFNSKMTSVGSNSMSGREKEGKKKAILNNIRANQNVLIFQKR